MKESLESQKKKSGLGKQVLKIVVDVLKSILNTWVSERVRRGARR